MFNNETEEKKPKFKEEIKIIPYVKNTMKIFRGNQYFILDPNRYDINALMMLIDLKKINKIEEKFKNFPDGLDRLTFIKLLKAELPTNASDPYDDVNMIYGLYKLFCEIDLSGDQVMQWSEFTQFIIDRVEGEDDQSDPNDTKGMKEKEMIKYKRYMISEKVKDYNIHKKDVISAVFYSKIDKLFVSEYDTKIIKMYNPKTGKCELNFDIEYYFQQRMIEEKKAKMGVLAKKQKIKVEQVKSLTFSILSLCMSPMNILAVCLSNNTICFFVFNIEMKGDCLYEMPTNPLQKRVWYLPNHGIWVSSGRKNEVDKFYYLYELDVDFERNGNKIECLYNKGHWHRNIFFENPSDPMNPNYGKGHRGEILDVIEISKPPLILTACMDGKIRLFSLNDKEYLKIWTTHEGGVRSLAYNPNIESNGLILSTGFEYHINVFSTDLSVDDAFKGKLEGHYAPVVCVQFLADSYMCASVDEEGCVKIWDSKQRQCLQSIPPDKKNLSINRLLYIKKYNRFLIYGNKMIFFDGKYRESEITKQKKDTVVNYPVQCEFNKYYMRIYVATNKDLRIYSSVNGNLLYVFKKFLEQERFDADTKIRCFTFDYRHRLIYIGFSNGTVQQFNCGNGSLIKPINEYEVEKDGMTMVKTHHTKDVTSMFVFYNNPETPDFDFILVTTGLDSLINMYNENDPEVSLKLRGIKNSHKIGEKQNEILCMDFSRRYNLFATGSIDGLVVVWDFELTKMEDLCYIPSYKLGSYNTIAMKFLDPYPVLAVVYSNGSLYLWGTKPNTQYKGQCFFRAKNFFRKESGFSPIQVNTLLFVNHEMNEIPVNLQFEKDFEENMPKDIEVDSDLQTNPNYYIDTKEKSYLLLGDSRGWLRCLNIAPILLKYSIEICDESTIQSSFNIMKREEVNAESSLVHNLQKEKSFLGNFISLYPNIIRYEKKIHESEIIHLSLIEEPFSFMTIGKDQRVKIWNWNCEIIGEIYTGINPIPPPLAEWKFNVDWEKLKKQEIEELLDIVQEVEGDISFLTKPSKDEPVVPEEDKADEAKPSSIFKTSVPVAKKRRFKKIEPRKEARARIEDENKINESFEGKYISETKRQIDEMFVRHGEEVGMNEMSRNVIDNIANNRDILELFQQPTQQVKTSSSKTLPKLSTSSVKPKEQEDEKKDLFSEKFIKKSDDNIRESLILPLINHEFKSNENVKFRQGETEKILAFEYYTNSYKECCRVKGNYEPIASLRQNYKLMWNFVDGYRKKKGKFKVKK